MKMKITPDKGTVENLLSRRLTNERQLLDEDNSALAKLTSTELKIHNPYQERETVAFRQSIARRQQWIADREQELELMRAHEAPRVLVEIDI